jgi:phosphatidylinositol alpha-1,6-mannosyltransferase
MKSHVFVFLQVFGWEGGIQSYAQDLLMAYHGLAVEGELHRGEVFLLRDTPPINFPSQYLNFRCFASRWLPWGRTKLVLALLTHFWGALPDHVFCGHIKLAPLIQWLTEPLGIPYTVFTHGKEVWYPLPEAQKQALLGAASIWTVSRYSGDRLSEVNQIPREKIQVVSCVVDTERFTPGEKSQELVDRYGLAGKQVLLTVARLWSGDIYKGVDITIRALPAIAAQFPDVKYLVIGRGDDQPRLAALAQELGVSDRVVFAGFVPTADLPDHYRLADAYVMPSQEGFGIVYLEAMACGVPVLAGDSDGSADPLQDGRLGWQVPHRDPEAVARACIEILQEGNSLDLQPQRSQGAWLRQEVIKGFSKSVFKDRLQKLLNSDN